MQVYTERSRPSFGFMAKEKECEFAEEITVSEMYFSYLYCIVLYYITLRFCDNCSNSCPLGFLMRSMITTSRYRVSDTH